jgi:hypothetical protein
MLAPFLFALVFAALANELMSPESLSGSLAWLALSLVLVSYTTYVFLTSALAFGSALDAGPAVGKALWEIRFIAETFINLPALCSSAPSPSLRIVWCSGPNMQFSGSARSVLVASERFAGLLVAEAGQNGGCCLANELVLVFQRPFEVANCAGILPASERGRRHDAHGGIRVFESRREGLNDGRERRLGACVLELSQRQRRVRANASIFVAEGSHEGLERATVGN